MSRNVTWLVDGKLKPPRPTGVRLPRELIRDKAREKNARLVVVQAPAGYGKTSAMAEGWERLNRDGGRAAWLSLDEHDADPLQFLCYLIAATTEVGCAVDYELPPHPQALAGSSLEFVTTAVLKALSGAAGPTHIFLDDFHRAECDETAQIVRRLLSDLPKTTLVISSRAYPRHIGAADLRARGGLVDVAHGALQFSAAEVDAYLGELIDAAHRADYCAKLAERTEGWPIALQAIRQLIKSGQPADAALTQASGRSGVLSDYFIEQVFDKLPETHQHMLLRTAIFERVNGDLADFICETGDAWALLDELERSDVFVQSLDPERQWYRYHKLFAEFLLERARRSPAVDRRRDSVRAAQWFGQKGFQAEAFQHALASQDAGLIAETLDAIGGWRHGVLGNLKGVATALSYLSDDNLKAYPRVWLAEIYRKLKLGEFEVAHQEFRALQRQIAGTATPNALLQNELAIFSGLITIYRDETSQLEQNLQHLTDMVATAGPDDHFLHATRLNLLCGLYARTAQFQQAVNTGEASIHHYRQVGSLYGESFIYFHEAIVFYRQGRLRDAVATLEQGLDIAASHFGPGSELYAVLAALAAMLAYDLNDLAKAQAYLDQALPMIEQCDSWCEVFIFAYTAGLALAASKGDFTAVKDVRRRAHFMAERRQLPRVAAYVDAYVAYLDIRHGFDDADKGPDDGALDNPPDTDIIELEALPLACVYARKLMRAGRNAEAARYLTERAREAEGRDLMRASITFSLVASIAYREAGDINAAAEQFDVVVRRSMFEDVKRPIIDEGPVVTALINDIESLAVQQRSNRLRDRFVAELMTEISAERRPNADAPSVLSPREKDVLRNLIQGRTNREIAQAVDASQNTVKFHLKNIYQKLGVSSREEAVRLSLRNRII
ncbi:MAG: LuxR C-terminal-related transcriptional regulator [Pseudomonadota bacterium]